jgi:hypothetical protein
MQDGSEVVMTVTRTTGRPAVALAALAAAASLAVAATWAAVTDRLRLGVDLGISAIAVAAVALLVAQMSRPPNIRIRIEEGQFVVRFRGWDALWTLRRELRLPLRQIEGVTVRHIDTVHARWWRRRRGTAVPGLIQAGSFTARGVRELWDVRDGADVVDIQLRASAPFRRLVLEVPSPSETVEMLRTSAGTKAS